MTADPYYVLIWVGTLEGVKGWDFVLKRCVTIYCSGFTLY